MKKIIAQTATAVCIVFTVMMAWFLAMGYLFAGPSYGLNLTASLYGAAFGMAALQAIWFTGALIKKLPYPARSAWLGQWLPAEDPGAWASFVVIYLFILAGMTAGYTVYYKKTAGGYDEALARYREQNRR